jgi:hypothetical protein
VLRVEAVPLAVEVLVEGSYFDEVVEELDSYLET